jgi:hypothetical protein
VVKADFRRIHRDIGINFPATGTNPIKVPLAHEHPPAPQALSPHSAFPPPPLDYPRHFIYLYANGFHL